MSGARKSEADADTLLSVGELAELADVSKTMIRRLVWSGDLPAVKLGRLLRVRLADWHAFLSAHRTQTRPMPVPARKPRAVSETPAPARLQ